MSKPGVDDTVTSAAGAPPGHGHPPRAPLAVYTDLDVTLDGQPVQVASTGDRLFVEFPSVRTALTALRAGIPTDDDRVDALLHTTALTIEVRVHEATVVVLGAAARPGVLSRAASVAPAELRLGGALAALSRGARTRFGRVWHRFVH